MEIALSFTSKTVFAEATVGEDGALHLHNPTPTLKPGAKVLLTISPQAETAYEKALSLLGTVLHYEDPFGPAASSF
jgi:hypothetical protein